MINQKTILFFLVVLFICNSVYSAIDLRKQDIEWTFDNDSNRICSYKAPIDYSYRIFDTIAYYWSSQFDSAADFSNAKFKKLANFRKGNFYSIANFKSARFYSDAFFTERVFNSIANFTGAYFKSETKFLGCQFDSIVNFSLAQFDFVLSDFSNSKFNYSDFRRAKFDSYAIFRGGEFTNISDFSNVYFNRGVNFNSVNFHSDVSFEGAQFDSVVDFRFVCFDSLANFKNAKFYSDVRFDSTLLPYYISFQNVQDIHNEIDLTNAKMNPEHSICNINLINANIEKIRFRYLRFNLFFPVGTDTEIKSNVYEELLNKLRKEGFIASYEKLDKEFIEFKYLEGSDNYSFGQITNWINKNWWGYGYDKELIFRNTLLLFFIFLIINFWVFSEMINKVYNIKSLTFSTNKINYLRSTNIPKIFGISIIYTAYVFFGLKFNYQNLKIKKNLKGWRFLYLVNFFLQYIVGLICLAYLANFIIST